MILEQSKGRPGIRPVGWLAIAGLAVAWFALNPMSRAQQPARDSHQPAALQTSAAAGQVDAQAAAALAEPGRTPADPKIAYGLWVLTPALVAILLAIFTRQVVPALVIGVLVGAFMHLRCLPNDNPYVQQNTVVGGARLAAEHYLLGAIHEVPRDGFPTVTFDDLGFNHVKIIVFTLLIGFIVGVINRNGGTEGLVRVVAGRSNSPRRGALTSWFAGLVIFFDDYANTMIIGPTMRSVFDRLKMSRAKLAYIIDSTAAPVASIALIGTWVGAEVGFIEQGLAGLSHPFLDTQGNAVVGMTAFLSSIPHRFYPIFAIVLTFLVCLTGRDFGPMKRAEREAQSRRIESETMFGDTSSASVAVAKPRWWLGLLPILVLVFATLAILALTGWHSPKTVAAVSVVTDGQAWADKEWWNRAGTVLSNANPNLSLFYGALLASIVAVLLTILARACPARDAVDAGLDGLARMMPAIVILVLAWAISQVMLDLQLGDIVAERLDAMNFNAKWLPLAVFVSAAVVSFATGTSWGTMGILCPMTVNIGARLMVGMEATESVPLMYAAIGSVLAGAVFGDHCSPISDTTVLSSIASGCRHEEHVWTQMPYALVAAVAEIVLGDILCSVYGQPWYVGVGAGTLFLVLFVFIFGRRAVPVRELGPV